LNLRLIEFNADRVQDAISQISRYQSRLAKSDVERTRYSDLSIFQKIGVAGPSSTPVSDLRHALGPKYCPSGM
jgi:hypothetical protein